MFSFNFKALSSADTAYRKVGFYQQTDSHESNLRPRHGHHQLIDHQGSNYFFLENSSRLVAREAFQYRQKPRVVVDIL